MTDTRSKINWFPGHMTKVKFEVWDEQHTIETALWEMRSPNLREQAKRLVCKTFGVDFDKLAETSDVEITEKIKLVYKQKLPVMHALKNKYQANWDKINDDVFKKLDQVFGQSLRMADLKARIWPCDLCPYQEDGFCVSGEKELAFKNIAALCIHETIHLYWWQVWNEVFKNEPTKLEPDGKNATWYLSEMAVEIIAQNTGFYRYLEDKKIAHNYFYDVKINNKDLFAQLNNLYASSQSIADFMKLGYDFVEKNYDEVYTQCRKR